MSKRRETLILGIDLGGTKILTSVVNSKGELLSRDHSITPASKGPEAVIQSILESSGRAMKQAQITSVKLTAVGVGAPGLSNPEQGILFTSPNLPGWQNVPLMDILGKEFGKKTFLINDANAAALGELYFGAAKGARNFIYITISTGIGGGFVIGGKLYTGARGIAGEVGHMTIDDDGPLCRCGNRGCWETLASGTALARAAKQRMKEGVRTSLLEDVDEIDKVTAEVIYKAAQAGDKLAGELIAQTGYYIGVGMANLINLFNPELIVIGGGLSHMGNKLLEPAYQVAGERAFGEAYKSVRFALAELGRNSGVIGAAMFALEEMKTEGKRKDEPGRPAAWSGHREGQF